MRQSLILVLLVWISFIAACRTPVPKSYVTPEVHLSKKSVEMGTPVDINYSFVTADDFQGFRKNLTVFVHFRDPHGTIRFVDDHLPPVRTNQWVSSEKYDYRRTVFVPENIPSGEYTIELGVYLPQGKGERIELNAKKITTRSYDVGKLTIRQPGQSAIRFLDGWYDVERDPSESFYHWRWTKGKAIAETPNPHADSILYLRGDSDQSKFPQPQTVSIRLNSTVVDEFQVSGSDEFVKRYEIPKNQLGDDANVKLEIDVNETFVPASKGNSADTRELGLRVLNFYLTPAK